MRPTDRSSGARILALLAVLVAAAAAPGFAATATRTFLASFGSDGNTCVTPADPCRSFSAASNQTAAGGQISVLDAGPYGSAFIEKSLTVDGDSAGGAVLGMAVSIKVGDGDIVVLRGLVLGGGFSTNAIRFAGSGTLHVESCIVDGTNNPNGGASGIFIAPEGASRVFVTDTVVRNLLTNDAHALRLFAAEGALTQLTLERVRFERNVKGIAVIAHEENSDGIRMTLRESVVAQHESHGIQVSGGPARGKVDVLIENTVVAGNGGGGVSCGGANAQVRLRNVTVTHNDVGVAGNVFSYGDNTVDENATDGVPAGLLGQT